MRLSGYRRIIAAVAGLCLLPHRFSPRSSRKYSGPATLAEAVWRHAADAGRHPDLTGVWNGLGDNLLGVPNQIATTVWRLKAKARRTTFTAAC